MCRSPSPGKWEGCDRKGIRLKISAPTTHIIMSESQQPLVRGKRLTIINDDDDVTYTQVFTIPYPAVQSLRLSSCPLMRQLLTVVECPTSTIVPHKM